MDLVACHDKTRVVVVMEHMTKNGGIKIMEQCEYPLTGKHCIDRIITEMVRASVDIRGSPLAGGSFITLTDGTHGSRLSD